MESKLLFVAGIHGVGKSTFCKIFRTVHSDFEYYSASELISHYKKDAFTESKLVTDIQDNQQVLLKSLESKRARHKLILLDGHFCLFDDDTTAHKISEDIFIKLKMDAIVLITAPVEAVVSRLGKRDGISHTMESLSQLQKLEIVTAQEIAKKLSIPLSTISVEEVAKNPKDIMSEIHRVIEK